MMLLLVLCFAQLFSVQSELWDTSSQQERSRSDSPTKVISVGIARRSSETDPDNELRTMIVDPDYTPFQEPLNYDDWCYSFDFVVNRNQDHPNMVHYYVGESYNPHRMIISPEHDFTVSVDEWTERADFWARNKQNTKNSLTAIYVGVSHQPKTQRTFLSLTPLDYRTWPDQTIFFVEEYYVPPQKDDKTCPMTFPSPNCVTLVDAINVDPYPTDGICKIFAHGSGILTIDYSGQRVFLARSKDGVYAPFFDEVGTLTISSPNNNAMTINFRSKEAESDSTCNSEDHTTLDLPGFESDKAGSAIDITPMFNHEAGDFAVSLSVRNAHGNGYTTDVALCTYNGRL